jgi:multicomponent Na+:H+ antiporter subunit G
VTPLEWAVLGLVGGSLAFTLVAAIGFVRLPDVFARAHAASKSETLGALLGLAAAALAFGPGQELLKVGLLAVFVLVTGPTAAHAVVRAASLAGDDPVTGADARHADGTAATSDTGGER